MEEKKLRNSQKDHDKQQREVRIWLLPIHVSKLLIKSHDIFVPIRQMLAMMWNKSSHTVVQTLWKTTGTLET